MAIVALTSAVQSRPELLIRFRPGRSINIILCMYMYVCVNMFGSQIQNLLKSLRLYTVHCTDHNIRDHKQIIFFTYLLKQTDSYSWS